MKEITERCYRVFVYRMSDADMIELSRWLVERRGRVEGDPSTGAVRVRIPLQYYAGLELRWGQHLEHLRREDR